MDYAAAGGEDGGARPARSCLARWSSGISASDLARANEQLAFLAGILSQVEETFEVRDQTSGFVPGLRNDRDYGLDTLGLFAQDSLSLRPNLTIREGLKWEYYTPLKEANDLALLPVLNGRSVREALLDPNGQVDFVSGGFYKSDRNNFAPTVGFAWDVFGDGKTAIQGGYTKAFVNEETLRVAENAVFSNDGLSTDVIEAGLYTTVAAGVPRVATPEFVVPRTYSMQEELSLTAAAYTPSTPT